MRAAFDLAGMTIGFDKAARAQRNAVIERRNQTVFAAEADDFTLDRRAVRTRNARAATERLAEARRFEDDAVMRFQNPDAARLGLNGQPVEHHRGAAGEASAHPTI